MKEHILKYTLLIVLLFVSIGWGDYRIVRSTVDGGGGQSTGGNYIVTGTIGQADAGYSAGAGYEVLGGYWPGGPLCFVDMDDFALFADYWLAAGTDLPADLDGNGTVDTEDLGRLVNWWLCDCPFGWTLK